jgi:hypothetical protein
MYEPMVESEGVEPAQLIARKTLSIDTRRPDNPQAQLS